MGQSGAHFTLVNGPRLDYCIPLTYEALSTGLRESQGSQGIQSQLYMAEVDQQTGKDVQLQLQQ